jgi:hypothetical protein
MAVDPLSQFSAKSADRILEPMDRISEVLFGLIMALTFTLTLGVVTADTIQVRTMLLAALGCNLAWGIIDAGVFLMARFNQRGRNVMQLRAIRAAADISDAHRIIAQALPPLLASALRPDQLELIRQRLLHLPKAEGPRLTKRDGLGAIGICLLSCLPTFPIVIPVHSDRRRTLGAAPLQCGRDRNAVRVRICVWPLRRLSTVVNGPLDGRHRCGAGRRCDRAWRMRAGTPPHAQRQRGSVTGLEGRGSPGLRSAASTENVTYAVHPSSRFLASNS